MLICILRNVIVVLLLEPIVHSFIIYLFILLLVECAIFDDFFVDFLLMFRVTGNWMDEASGIPPNFCCFLLLLRHPTHSMSLKSHQILFNQLNCIDFLCWFSCFQVKTRNWVRQPLSGPLRRGLRSQRVAEPIFSPFSHFSPFFLNFSLNSR